MNCVIPFESKVKFKSPVKEICSISLEHEISKNDSQVLGNFFITGTYKEHELSVNTSDFKFTIPFSLELARPVDRDTIEFSIDNFTYELINDELLVKIDYVVDADDIKEENNIDPLDLIEEAPDYKEKIEEKFIEPEIEEVREKAAPIEPEMINNLEVDDDYMTYHVHIVKEEETLDSIALLYKVDKDEILKLNGGVEFASNTKILVPFANE